MAIARLPAPRASRGRRRGVGGGVGMLAAAQPRRCGAPVGVRVGGGGRISSSSCVAATKLRYSSASWPPRIEIASMIFRISRRSRSERVRVSSLTARRSRSAISAPSAASRIGLVVVAQQLEQGRGLLAKLALADDADRLLAQLAAVRHQRGVHAVGRAVVAGAARRRIRRPRSLGDAQRPAAPAMASAAARPALRPAGLAGATAYGSTPCPSRSNATRARRVRRAACRRAGGPGRAPRPWRPTSTHSAATASRARARPAPPPASRRRAAARTAPTPPARRRSSRSIVPSVERARRDRAGHVLDRIVPSTGGGGGGGGGAARGGRQAAASGAPRQSDQSPAGHASAGAITSTLANVSRSSPSR